MSALLALIGGPAWSQQGVSNIQPLTLKGRVKWVARSSTSPKKLGGDIFSAGIAVANRTPVEYGTHWDGFGKRIGMRMATGATGLALEAGIGALWNEDPRYRHAPPGTSAPGRVWNVVKMSFATSNAEGKVVPAYARYIAVPANSFLTNSFRPDSQADTRHAIKRIPLSFIDRIIGNTFSEFFPDIMRAVHKKRSASIASPPANDND